MSTEPEAVDLKNQSVCVLDFGLFHHIAEAIAPAFGKTYYVTPWQKASPKSCDQDVGSGFPGVERIQTFWDRLDDFNLICVFDCYYADVQIHLEQLGKRVWGSRRGDLLETDRIASKAHIEALGLDIGPYKIIKGLDDLRDHLKHNRNKWVKTSGLRGDWESTHAKNYNLTEIELDDLEHILGRRKKRQEFIVEDDIPDAVEVAVDTYCVDGQYPQASLVGIESKCQAYIGHWQPRARWPQPLVNIYDALTPTLEEAGVRSFFAVEARQTKDGKAYVVDPCLRCSSPCSEVQDEMLTNLPEILWHGAGGVMVEPVPAGRWAAQIQLHSKNNHGKEQPVFIPKEIRKYVKLVNACYDGLLYSVMPSETSDAIIGAAVCVADSMEEAMDGAAEYAEQVEGPGICTDDHYLRELKDDIRRLKDYGVTL